MARVTTRIPGPGPRDESPRDDFDAEHHGDDHRDYHGAHRRPDEGEEPEYAEYTEYTEYGDYPEEYKDYPEDRSDAEVAAAPAGSTAVVSGGVPKRGLAMILIAVAALLLLWGIYALTQRDGEDAATGEVSTQTSTVATDTVVNTVLDTVANTAPAGQASPSVQASPANPAVPAPSADAPAAQNGQEGQEGQEAQAPAAPAPAPSGPALTAGDAQVFVYNNSGIPNAATDTAKRLDQQYAIANNSPDPAAMNMPEQNYGVFPETYVFYDPQVNGAEQIAADVAQRVGGTPRAVGDLPQGAAGLPSEAKGRNAITVVIAG